MNGRGVPLLGMGLILAGVLAIGSAYALAPATTNAANPTTWTSMMGANGHGMMGGNGYGMMGGAGMMGRTWTAPTSAPGPGQAGFVAGTASAPRIVHFYALPNDRFAPETVTVQAGETVSFEVTTMGPILHEFMVGPAADVAADKEGTPEVADIGMMQTKTVTYTFNGTGPFAFACHVPGHYEAGMKGTIVVK